MKKTSNKKKQLNLISSLIAIIVSRNNMWEASVFDNFSSRYNQINSDFFSISNHLHDKPYPKTLNGEKLFRNIIYEYNAIDKKSELIEKLFEFAKYDAG